jgi:hypothetical protein
LDEIAVTRLLTCGYETGDINEAGVTTTGVSGVVAAVNTTPTPRLSGSYCLKCTSAAVNAQAYKTLSFGTKTEVWLRFGFWAHPATSTTEGVIAGLLDSTSALQACLTFNPSDGLLRARQYGSVGSVAGTLLGTSSLTMSIDTWHLIECRHQITSATAGTTEVWLDGARVINFTGDNTQTGTAVNVAFVQLGVMVATSVAGLYWAFDDIAVNDTSGSINNGQIFDGRVALLKPTGAGSNTAQTRGGTDSGANWNQVDEFPPSMTDYVFSATAATRDTYALGDLPAGTWAVNCCEVLAYAQNSDAGAGSLGLTVKSGSTTNEGTAQSLTTTAQYFRQLYETDPATSAAWTTAAVNALEAGTTVR